ncbi:hypothetical protein [Pandoraea capi]|nr:hypothetical protein [Pandoraea capi]
METEAEAEAGSKTEAAADADSGVARGIDADVMTSGDMRPNNEGSNMAR